MFTFPSGLNKKAKNHQEYLNKMVILYKYLHNIKFLLKLKTSQKFHKNDNRYLVFARFLANWQAFGKVLSLYLQKR
jgi:hypothetical protein